jgi:hypothetical protein
MLISSTITLTTLFVSINTIELREVPTASEYTWSVSAAGMIGPYRPAMWQAECLSEDGRNDAGIGLMAFAVARAISAIDGELRPDGERLLKLETRTDGHDGATRHG